MESNKAKDLSDDRKRLLKKDVADGLEGLKEIIVGAITVVINIVDSFSQKKNSSSITAYKFNNTKSKSNSWLSNVQENSQNSKPEPLDVSVEIDESKFSSNSNKFIPNLLYPLLATISTSALVAGVLKIDPVIKWAETQNECIESTVSIDSKSPINIASKVMTCNGGHLN